MSTTTVDVYLVAQSADDARRTFPFFDEDQATDYAADHGGRVFTAEAVVTVDAGTIRET